MTSRLSDFRTELEATEKLKIELTSKLEASRKKMVESETDYGKVASEMDGISQILKRSVKETEKEIDELKSTYIDRLNEEATIRNDLKHIEERLEGEKSSSERIRQQTSLLKERLAHLTAEKKEKVTGLSELKKKLKNADAAYRESSQTLRKTEDELRVQQEFMQKAFNKQHEMQWPLEGVGKYGSRFFWFLFRS